MDTAQPASAASRCPRSTPRERNPNKTAFRLPFTFMFTGMFCLIIFQFAVLTAHKDWAEGMPRTPAGWSVSHLLVLGWATMVAMGAVYQLLHVVLNQKVYSEGLGYLHYTLFAGGLIGLTYGFIQIDTMAIAVSASAALIGILVFVGNLAVTLFRAKQWNAITLHVSSALFYLALTAISGLLMGMNFRFGFMSGFHEQLLAAHIWAGLVGWFGLLIVGFSYKMLPMFYLSHNYPVRLQSYTLLLLNLGLLGMLAVLLLGGSGYASAVPLLVLTGAIVVYNVHIQQIIRHRHKAKPGYGIQISVWSARAWALTFAVGAITLLVKPELWSDYVALTFFIYLYFMGFVALTILGYLSKIAPFLWWTHKYGHLVGKQNVPALADMISEPWIRKGLLAVTAGIAAVSAGLALRSPDFVLVAQLLLSAATLFYISLILRVFRQ